MALTLADLRVKLAASGDEKSSLAELEANCQSLVSASVALQQELEDARRVHGEDKVKWERAMEEMRTQAGRAGADAR